MADETQPEATTDYKEGAFADEPVGGASPPVKVHVVAPATLPEGYVFEAEVGPIGAKRTIGVEVPQGGVVEGQAFLIPLPDDFAVGEPRVNVPTGKWKDGPFDLLNAGFFHPSLWCGVCFTQGEWRSAEFTLEHNAVRFFTLTASDAFFSENW